MCKMCCQRVTKENVPTHKCSEKYRLWRDPFVREKPRIAFVGMAPPVPGESKPRVFKYIYKDPDSEFEPSRTDSKWRDALEHALTMKPELRERYPHMATYFNSRNSMTKRPFLDAMRDSEVTWIDCVEFPIETKEVRGLLRNEVYAAAFGKSLACQGYGVAIFMSKAQRSVAKVFSETTATERKPPVVTVLPGTFWRMDVEVAGRAIAEALSSHR